MATVFQSAPLIRGETELGEIMCPGDPFQSTSLIRGETANYGIHTTRLKFQSTPSYEGRHIPSVNHRAALISIHSPHTRGDVSALRRQTATRNFNPLPSCEGRQKPRRVRAPLGYFNPLPSCEGRRAATCGFSTICRFQSAPLTRGETGTVHGFLRGRRISIRSPHTRGDSAKNARKGEKTHFNPLPSHEGRQHKPPKIHPDLRQLTQQNHDTPLFGALQAPFCGAKPDIRCAKPTEKP